MPASVRRRAQTTAVFRCFSELRVEFSGFFRWVDIPREWHDLSGHFECDESIAHDARLDARFARGASGRRIRGRRRADAPTPNPYRPERDRTIWGLLECERVRNTTHFIDPPLSSEEKTRAVAMQFENEAPLRLQANSILTLDESTVHNCAKIGFKFKSFPRTITTSIRVDNKDRLRLFLDGKRGFCVIDRRTDRAHSNGV